MKKTDNKQEAQTHTHTHTDVFLRGVNFKLTFGGNILGLRRRPIYFSNPNS